jgi:hypothetical protein
MFFIHPDPFRIDCVFRRVQSLCRPLGLLQAIVSCRPGKRRIHCRIPGIRSSLFYDPCAPYRRRKEYIRNALLFFPSAWIFPDFMLQLS